MIPGRVSRPRPYGVTLKDVAKQANTHRSLLHYYFEDEKAVFARRAAERRMAALGAYAHDCGGKPTVTGALVLTLARTGRIDELSGGRIPGYLR